MPSRAYTSFLQEYSRGEMIPMDLCVNALSGLYLISTKEIFMNKIVSNVCQCPLGLIPHFYGTPSKT